MPLIYPVLMGTSRPQTWAVLRTVSAKAAGFVRQAASRSAVVVTLIPLHFIIEYDFDNMKSIGEARPAAGRAANRAF